MFGELGGAQETFTSTMFIFSKMKQRGGYRTFGWFLLRAAAGELSRDADLRRAAARASL